MWQSLNNATSSVFETETVDVLYELALLTLWTMKRLGLPQMTVANAHNNTSQQTCNDVMSRFRERHFDPNITLTSTLQQCGWNEYQSVVSVTWPTFSTGQIPALTLPPPAKLWTATPWAELTRLIGNNIPSGAAKLPIASQPSEELLTCLQQFYKRKFSTTTEQQGMCEYQSFLIVQ
jgi:hypothetical protein